MRWRWRRLFGVEWPVWELRSAFFPMLVVYPAQRFAAWIGASSQKPCPPLERRLVNAAVLLGVAGLTLLGITAVADALYWGSPLASIAAIIDYTLVPGESSRGYQPPWEYARAIPAWTTLLFAGLAVAGSGSGAAFGLARRGGPRACDRKHHARGAPRAVRASER